MSLPFCKSWGGSEETHPDEENDCAVRALAIAACVSYAEAHSYLTRFSREPRKGMNYKFFSESLIRWNKNKIKQIPFSGKIADLKRRIESGNSYIVGTRGHVFAIRQGRIWDYKMPGMKQKVTELWKID